MRTPTRLLGWASCLRCVVGVASCIPSSRRGLWCATPIGHTPTILLLRASPPRGARAAGQPAWWKRPLTTAPTRSCPSHRSVSRCVQYCAVLCVQQCTRSPCGIGRTLRGMASMHVYVRACVARPHVCGRAGALEQGPGCPGMSAPPDAASAFLARPQAEHCIHVNFGCAAPPRPLRRAHRVPVGFGITCIEMKWRMPLKSDYT